MTDSKISIDDFNAYVAVQKSGMVNMFDVKTVGRLTDLSRAQLLDIMKNYSKYSATYNIKLGW